MAVVDFMRSEVRLEKLSLEDEGAAPQCNIVGDSNGIDFRINLQKTIKDYEFRLIRKFSVDVRRAIPQ